MIKKIIKKPEDIYDEVANIYISTIKGESSINLGLATGSTPIPLYDKLVNAYKEEKISFKNVKSFNLDEYCGISSTNPNSYRMFMNEKFFNKIDINLGNTFFPTVENVDQYNKMLEENQIDIQLLGIGSNGHIAFNEPGGELDSLTRIVDLAPKTIEDNARFFNSKEEVPKQAISMGLQNILNAKKIILIAIGKNKANILKEIFENDEVINGIPASVLKTHPDVTFYMDEEAASLIK